MALVRDSKLRFVSFGLAVLALTLGVGAFLQTGSAAQPVLLHYTDTITTKQNAVANPPAPHVIDAFVTGATGPVESIAVIPDGAAAPGSLRLDTSITTAWKAPLKLNATTWQFTLKAQDVNAAAVYINGDFRALRAGTTVTFKFTASNRGQVFVKAAGFTTAGTSNATIAIESTSSGNSSIIPTATPTNTATNTATNTPTNTATNTATNTPTNTPAPPTSTPTNTPIPPTPTATNTPLPS